MQWLQTNQYHSDLHIAQVGNWAYYNDREVGEQTGKIEKCLCGGCLSTIILFFLVGPFLLFSNAGVLADFNDVSEATFSFDFAINKTLTEKSFNFVPYVLYQNKYPMI